MSEVICCPRCKSHSLAISDHLKTKLYCGCCICGLDFWISKKQMSFDDATKR